MNTPNNNLRVRIWDLGPKEPRQPKKPAPPDIKDPDSPAGKVAAIDFEDAMAAYRAEVDAYVPQKRAFDRWHAEFGGPYQMEMWSVNASEAMTRDHDRYVRTLPRGMKPGRAHLENENRREQEMADLQVARENDPQFGARGAAA